MGLRQQVLSLGQQLRSHLSSFILSQDAWSLPYACVPMSPGDLASGYKQNLGLPFSPSFLGCPQILSRGCHCPNSISWPSGQQDCRCFVGVYLPCMAWPALRLEAVKAGSSPGRSLLPGLLHSSTCLCSLWLLQASVMLSRVHSAVCGRLVQ